MDTLDQQWFHFGLWQRGGAWATAVHPHFQQSTQDLFSDTRSNQLAGFHHRCDGLCGDFFADGDGKLGFPHPQRSGDASRRLLGPTGQDGHAVGDTERHCG